MHLTIPLISKPSQRASLFSLPPVIAALPAATIASPKQLTASPPTPLLPLPTTLPSAAPISATLTPAPTLPTGIPAIRPPSVRPSLTFRKSPGMIPAPAHFSLLTWATAQPTAQQVFATIRSTAPSSRPPWVEEVAPANAQPGRRLQAASSAALARDGRNLPGRASSAIPTTACATRLTFRSLPPTVCGVTSIYFAGRIPRTVELLEIGR